MRFSPRESLFSLSIFAPLPHRLSLKHIVIFEIFSGAATSRKVTSQNQYVNKMLYL